MAEEHSISQRLASQELLERLAAVEHDRWARWQQYVHEQCSPTGDGSLIIPVELVERWAAQISTPYQDLSDREKQSDRDQVARYLPLIQSVLDSSTPGSDRPGE